MDMTAFEGVFSKTPVLVTGHTGFKGSWGFAFGLNLWGQG
jgi:hypothetical protein